MREQEREIQQPVEPNLGSPKNLLDRWRRTRTQFVAGESTKKSQKETPQESPRQEGLLRRRKRQRRIIIQGQQAFEKETTIASDQEGKENRRTAYRYYNGTTYERNPILLLITNLCHFLQEKEDLTSRKISVDARIASSGVVGVGNTNGNEVYTQALVEFYNFLTTFITDTT